MTSSYDDITTSGEVDTVITTFQHNSCNNGEPVTVINHASGNFVDGIATLNPSFAQCIITANS